MREKVRFDATTMMAVAAIMLMALCCLCAPLRTNSVASSFSGAQSGSGRNDALVVSCACIPGAVDAGIPSSITTPTTGANFARLPSRSNFRAATGSLLRTEYLPAVLLTLCSPRPAEAAFNIGTPEFTPFLFIKTTCKRE